MNNPERMWNAAILALVEASRDIGADGYSDAAESDRFGGPAERCESFNRTQPGYFVKKIDRALLAQAKSLDWETHVRRCQAIPGVDPLTALAIVATYHRGQFRNDDAFIAFMGMDVRIRESGRFRGRRKLTKKGEPELRRLLFNAAMRGRQHSHCSCK